MAPPDPPHPPLPDLSFPVDPADLTWDDALALLVALTADDLLHDREPVPTLLAFGGDAPIALIGLRPFGQGEIGQALLEVLSLVVPLGADRLALGASGRVWSLDDPIPPVCPDGDLRQRAIIVALADAREGSCRLETSIHPFDGAGADLVLHPPLFPGDGLASPTVDGGGESNANGTLAPPVTAADDAGMKAVSPWDGGPAAAMLVGALEQREELTHLTGQPELLAQLGRVLLLGHELALAPDPAAELTSMWIGPN